MEELVKYILNVNVIESHYTFKDVPRYLIAIEDGKVLFEFKPLTDYWIRGIKYVELKRSTFVETKTDNVFVKVAMMHVVDFNSYKNEKDVIEIFKRIKEEFKEEILKTYFLYQSENIKDAYGHDIEIKLEYDIPDNYKERGLVIKKEDIRKYMFLE